MLILAGVILAVAGLYSVYALRIATFQSDEELYMRLARNVALHFPSALWQAGIYTRGLQRLDPVLLSAPFFFMRGPGAFQIDHVLQCLLFASTALPVFLLARKASLPRPESHLVAALAIVVPWAVVSSSFLSESLAYPVFAWTLYAAWLIACEPSPRHEVLGLAAIVVAVFSRTALLALAPLLPLAAIWQTWSWELTGMPLLKRLRALPGRLWSSHRLMSLFAIAAVLAYVADRLGLLPGSVTTLTGSYGTPNLPPLSQIFESDRYYLSRAVAGTGFIAAAIGLPWAVATLARPRTGPRHGLAVVCALSLLCMLISLLRAGLDERYIVYATIPIMLAFVAGLRERNPLGVVLGAIVVVLLIDSVTWPALANLYDYFTYPAAIFYVRVLTGHVHELPLIHFSADRTIEGAIVLVAIAWALVGRHGRAAGVLSVAVGLGVLALGATQTLYVLDKYSSGAGKGASASERSWIDRHVPSGEHAATLAVSLGTSEDFLAIWREAEFWNTSITETASFGSPGFAPLPLGILPVSLTIQPGSGLLSASTVLTSHQPVPRLLLVPRISTLTAGLEVEHSEEDPALLLNLVRLRQPARLDWALTGTSAEGFMAPGEPAHVLTYSGAFERGEDCATFSLLTPPNFTGRWRYLVLDAKHRLRQGSLAAQEARTLTVPLDRGPTPHGPAAQFQIKVDGSVLYPGGKTVSARIENLSLRHCPAGGG
jgi:hypothetical protein